MKNNLKFFSLGVATTILFSFLTVVVGAAMQQKTIDISYGDIKIVVDGNTIEPKDANGNSVEPFISDGTTYLPVRAVANAFGKDVSWDGETKTVYLGTKPSNNNYSRTNPAPLGVTQTTVIEEYKPDYSGKYKFNAIVTVKDVCRGADAWEMLKNANMFNDEPSEGNEYILAYVSLSVDNLPEEYSASISSSDFSFYSTDYSKYTNRTYCVMPDDKNMNGTLFDGASMEGYICQEIKIGDSTPTVVFNQDYNGTGGIWFSLAR